MDNVTPNSASNRKRLRPAQNVSDSLVQYLHHSNEAVSQPDIVAAFAARAGRAESLQQDLDRVRQKAQQQADTLLQVKTDLSSLRDENSRLSALSRAEINQTQHAREKAEKQLESEIRRSAALEARLASSLTANRSEMNDSRFADRENLDQQSFGRSENLLKAEIEQLKKTLQQQEGEASDAADRLKHEKQLAADTASANETHARRLQELLDEALGASEAAQEAAAAARSEAAAARQQSATDAAKQSAQSGSTSVTVELANVRAEMSRMEQEVAEARKLRAYVTNVEALREKLRTAEARAQRAEATAEAAAANQPLIFELQREVDKWNSFYQGVPDVTTPEDILHKLQQLQKDAAAQSDRLAQATASLESTRGQLARAEERLNEQQEAAGDTEHILADAVANTARVEQRLALAQQERDGLKRIVSSYQSDMTSEAATAERVELTAGRNQLLEQAVETLQQQVKDLEADLLKRTAEQATLQAAATEGASHLATSESAAEQLRIQVAEMQTRLGRGEFDRTTTRVLHWVRNPEAEQQREDAANRIASIEAENTALRSQLQKQEDVHQRQRQQKQHLDTGSVGVATPSVEAALVDSEIANSKRKIAELEKGTKRLKEAFNLHITSFREACHFLFGYRIEMATKPTSTTHGKAPPTTFTLTPAGGDTRTQLRFASQANSNGLRLLQTPYTEKLKQEVATYIDRFCSIPAFLANLTMENFQRNTQQ